jgi:hypothetical protein
VFWMIATVCNGKIYNSRGTHALPPQVVRKMPSEERPSRMIDCPGREDLGVPPVHKDSFLH